jgi:hypothetical protein
MPGMDTDKTAVAAYYLSWQASYRSEHPQLTYRIGNVAGYKINTS